MRISILALLAVGCANVDPIAAPSVGAPLDRALSPSDPRDFDAHMFNESALARFSLSDRAYVQGHALAVYLYGKTLPRYVAGTGFIYHPGLSSPRATVAYDWQAVLVARSGGSDSNGVPAQPNTQATSAPCDPDAPKNCLPDPTQPKTPTPTPTPSDQPPTWLDDDCNSFLEPAADEAVVQSRSISVASVLGHPYAGMSLTTYEARFKRGVADALDQGDDRGSEIDRLRPEAIRFGLCDGSPLVLDLSGDGVEASPLDEGVRFDLLDHGATVQTAWPRGDDALLALDRNGDGEITSGGELFGNTPRPHGGRFTNGFESLATLDTAAAGGNSDGLIDRRDAQFVSLRLWRDADRNGKSSPSELHPLATEGITEIGLHYSESTAVDRFGNHLRQQGVFVRQTSNGARREGSIVDLWFRFRP